MTSVTLLELPAHFGDVEAQLAAVDAELAAAPPGDLVLLPELALTGYVSPALDFDVSRLAERHACTVVGPLVERARAQRFNAVLGFSAAGQRWLHYRKRHPWMPESWATPGDLPMPLVGWAGLTVTAAICFDVHFLAEEAADVLRAADLLLFASAWVEEVDSRPTLLGELARTFDLAIVNANWGPGVPRIPGQGRSMAVHRDGRVVAQTQPGQRRLDVSLTSLGL
jgi:predicted amidohydrolase